LNCHSLSAQPIASFAGNEASGGIRVDRQRFQHMRIIVVMLPVPGRTFDIGKIQQLSRG